MDWVRFTVSEQSQSPKAPGQSGDRLGRADWAGERCNCQTKKPHVLGNGKRAPGHLPHSREAKMHVPAYRTRVQGYQDATVSPSIATSLPARRQHASYVPILDLIPQTGRQRAFHQVHPGPLRFHPPTPKLPERPLIAAYCPVRCQAQRRGAWEGRYMVPYRIPYCRPSPSLALAHGAMPLFLGWRQQHAAAGHARKAAECSSSPHRARAK